MKSAPPQTPNAPPGAAGGAPGAMPPQASPLSQPQDKRGKETAALTNVQIAISLLEQAISTLGSGSEHGKAVLKALNTLGPLAVKKDTSDLVPAEIMQMVRSLPQAGGGTDIQKQLLAQMKGGAAGGGAPPARPGA
jgi:hypothetical protein